MGNPTKPKSKVHGQVESFKKEVNASSFAPLDDEEKILVSNLKNFLEETEGD